MNNSTKIFRPFTSSTDKEFVVSFLDISKAERRLLRVTSKTYESSGTSFFLKLFEKRADGGFQFNQLVTQTVPEFQELIKSEENNNMGPQTVKRDKTTA